VRSALFMIFASGLWALLPAVARRCGAGRYGLHRGDLARASAPAAGARHVWDLELEAAAGALTMGGTEPLVRHLIWADALRPSPDQ
jgi:hypothetical protein